MRSYKTIIILSFTLLALFISPVCHSAGGELKGETTAASENSEIHDLLLQMEKQGSDFNSLKTDFVQEKNLAIFQNRIIIKGRIYIQKSGKVAWHVDEPVKYSVLITDKFIRQWDEDTNRVQEIPLSKNPMFRVVIDQLTAWFSGQYIRLLNDYDVSLINKQPLEIEFRPRESSNVKKIIKAITIKFREDGRYLHKVQFNEVSGDSTAITFNNTVFNAPTSSADFEVKRLVR